MSRRGRFRANVLHLDDVGTGYPSDDPHFHDHLILAEGDSWFSVGGFPPTNLLHGLRFRKHTMVVSCAQPGDTIGNMAQIAKNALFERALSVRFGYDWDVILLSGGGNDLIDNAGRIVLGPDRRRPKYSSDPDRYISKPNLKEVLDVIKAGYRSLAAARDSADSRVNGVPMLAHTYDYAVPRNEPARFFGFDLQGPWLYRAFTDRDVPTELWIPLARLLMDRLAETLLGLQAGRQRIAHFHVVDTRDTLTPPGLDDVGPTTYWLNEIHPNFEGYAKLGRQIERERLYGLLYP